MQAQLPLEDEEHNRNVIEQLEKLAEQIRGLLAR